MRYTMAVLSIVVFAMACGDEQPLPPDCAWPKIPGVNLPASFCTIPPDEDPPTTWGCAWFIGDKCIAEATGPFCTDEMKFRDCPP